MSRHQLSILRKLVVDGVDPKKSFELINGKFVQSDKKDSEEVKEANADLSNSDKKIDNNLEEELNNDVLNSHNEIVENLTSQKTEKKKKSTKSKTS